MDPVAAAVVVAPLAAVAAVAVVAFCRSRTAERAIREWAANAGLLRVTLRSTSWTPSRWAGPVRLGDVVYGLRAIGPGGESVSGLVKCNLLRRGRDMPATVEAQLTRSPVSGFPVRPVGGG